MSLDRSIAPAPVIAAPRWGAPLIVALAAQLRRVLAIYRAEYVEPDPFSTEQPFIGDDLFGSA
jgi:hypothetical protein